MFDELIADSFHFFYGPGHVWGSDVAPNEGWGAYIVSLRCHEVHDLACHVPVLLRWKRYSFQYLRKTWLNKPALLFGHLMKALVRDHGTQGSMCYFGCPEKTSANRPFFFSQMTRVSNPTRCSLGTM
jgi:hypothetical protein